MKGEEPMSLYCGIDLHSNNSYVAVLDEERRDVECRRLRNELPAVLGFLEHYKEDIEAIGWSHLQLVLVGGWSTGGLTSG
jgi:hypothetical protein